MPGSHLLPTPNPYHSLFRGPDGSHDWQTELDYGFSLVDRASCGSLAAVIIEPILSSGGMIPLPAGYLRALKAHCQRRGMLLILDEAQTAFGRAGDLFAFHHENNFAPDILTLSKTLGNGLPLSAVITSHQISKTCEQRGFLFYTTHANDPLPAAVGLKVVDIVLRDDLVSHARSLGSKLHASLRNLQSRYACIGEVRGRGLMAGMEIVVDRRKGKEKSLDLGARLETKMMDLGLSASLSGSAAFAGVFRIAPPIIVTESQLEAALDIMERAFKETDGTLALYEEVNGNVDRIERGTSKL